jgi:tetratricopeptide (TPR) repeat protein
VTLPRSFSMAIATAVMAMATAAQAAPADAPAQTPPAQTPPAQAAPGEAPAQAPAEAKPPAREDRVKAAAELKRGMKLIAEQKYDEAIAAISSAYALDPKTEHLYNLGVAYHLKGDKRAALDHYQRFLASGSKNRQLLKVAKDYATQLEAELAAEDAARIAREKAEADRKTAAEEEARRKAAEDAEKQRLADEAARRDRERVAPAPATTVSGGGRGKRAIGTGLLVAGGAALGVAVLAGLDARSANDELDGLGEGDQWTISKQWLHDRGESSEQRALIFGIAGGALVAGGAVLYYLGERDARRGGERPVAVAPVLGAGVAGVGVAGAF